MHVFIPASLSLSSPLSSGRTVCLSLFFFLLNNKIKEKDIAFDQTRGNSTGRRAQDANHLFM